jgi:hypothetical protein
MSLADEAEVEAGAAATRSLPQCSVPVPLAQPYHTSFTFPVSSSAISNSSLSCCRSSGVSESSVGLSEQMAD